jgi:hypothetical protein
LGLRHPLRLWAKRGIFAAPIGKAEQIRSANKKLLQIFFYSLRIAYWRSANCKANSIDAA